MFKAMILLTRREDLTHDAWVAWWLDEHAPLAARLPNLRRGVFNVVEVGADEAAVDGVSELWFDSRADFDAAYATEIGREVAADSLAHVSGRVRVFVGEHEVDRLPASGDQRRAAIDDILAADPMPVPADPRDLRRELDDARERSG